MNDAPDASAEQRAAVVLIAPDAIALGVYARLDWERLRAHARRRLALHDAGWPAARDAMQQLVALACARGAKTVAVALRASLRGLRWGPRALEAARRLRCQALALTADDELRFLFLGAVRSQRADDGVVVELEPRGMALARFRGRVMAGTARMALGGAPAETGFVPAGVGETLVATGSLAMRLAARLDGHVHERAPLLRRAALARAARAKSVDGTAAAALERLLHWMGKDAAVVAPDALVDGLAATALRAPVPPLHAKV